MNENQENTKVVKDEDLENAGNSATNQEPGVQEPEQKEVRGFGKVWNGVKQVGSGLKEAAIDNKQKLIGIAAGVIAAGIGYNKLKKELSKGSDVEVIDVTPEPPLLESKPEPEYPEVCGFMYDSEMNEHVFNSKEEALETLNAIVPDEEPEIVSTENVTVDETTTE